jgi:hypothetical protein
MGEGKHLERLKANRFEPCLMVQGRYLRTAVELTGNIQLGNVLKFNTPQ